MQVDTDSAVSIISRDTKQRVFSEEPLQVSQMVLQTYTGEKIEVLGKLLVKVNYQKQSESLRLVVTEGSGPSLFGRDWLAKLRLDWSHTKRQSFETVQHFVGVDYHKLLRHFV